MIEPDGWARMASVIPGTYRVEVSCKDHLDRDDYPTIAVKDADAPPLTWEVDKGATARIDVVDEQRRPITKATVTAFASGPQGSFGRAKPRRDGRRFPPLGTEARRVPRDRAVRGRGPRRQGRHHRAGPGGARLHRRPVRGRHRGRRRGRRAPPRPQRADHRHGPRLRDGALARRRHVLAHRPAPGRVRGADERGPAPTAGLAGWRRPSAREGHGHAAGSRQGPGDGRQPQRHHRGPRDRQHRQAGDRRLHRLRARRGRSGRAALRRFGPRARHHRRRGPVHGRRPRRRHVQPPRLAQGR